MNTATTNTLTPSATEIAALAAKHLLVIDRSTYVNGVISLTPEGHQFFTSAGLTALIGGHFVLQAPLKERVIEITGISDVDGDASGKRKIVDYTWNYDFGEAPAPVTESFRDYHDQTGHAEIRLYDDGWRVVKP
jgi:hypothetical protein